MSQELDRRSFLRRVGQTSGFLAASGSLGSLLAACGNVSSGTTTSSSSSTPGAETVGNSGLKTPSFFQWGSTSDGGAPYVFQDPKKPTDLVGFEVDIAAAIAKLMKVTEKQVETDYAQLDRALAAAKFDAIMNGWEITDDRKKTELFSQSYYHYGQQVVVKADDSRFSSKDAKSTLSLTDLEGYTVGTGASYKAAELLATDSKIKLKTYDPDLPFNDLALGRIDAVLIDLPIVTYYVQGIGPGSESNSKLRAIGAPFELSDYVIAFNKSDPTAATLLKEVDQAITIIKGNGTLRQILQKWDLWNDQQAQIGTK